MKMKRSKLDMEEKELMFHSMQERCGEAIVYMSHEVDKEIIDNVANDGESLVITFKDAGLPMEERDYTLYFNDEVCQADAIYISQCDTNCNAVRLCILTDEMEYAITNEIHMSDIEFIEFKSNETHDEFELIIITRPPWSVMRLKDSDIIDAFPIVEQITGVGVNRLGIVFNTVIEVYLSPLDMKKIRYAKVVTPINKGAALHDAKVLETVNELKTIETINIVPGSHIIESSEDDVAIYEIDYIDGEGCIGTHLINDEGTDVIPIGSLIDDRYTVIPKYKTIFAYWDNDCPILCGAELKPQHYESVSIHVESVIDALDVWEKLDRDAVNALAEKKAAGKRIYPSRNNTCKELKDLGLMLVSARYHLNKLMDICEDDQVNIYVEDKQRLFAIMRSDIETPINILRQFQEDMQIDFGV